MIIDGKFLLFLRQCLVYLRCDKRILRRILAVLLGNPCEAFEDFPRIHGLVTSQTIVGMQTTDSSKSDRYLSVNEYESDGMTCKIEIEHLYLESERRQQEAMDTLQNLIDGDRIPENQEFEKLAEEVNMQGRLQ